jgi:galactose mutarotase-like enzyme
MNAITLANEHLVCTISAIGAEVTSLFGNKHGVEYIWSGDKTFWGRHAPVLFPIVGKLNNDTFMHDGTSYQLPQHGFARDMTFELQSSTDTSAHFTLLPTAESRMHYPFDFELNAHITLSDSTLHATYELAHHSTIQSAHILHLVWV